MKPVEIADNVLKKLDELFYHIVFVYKAPETAHRILFTTWKMQPISKM